MKSLNTVILQVPARFSGGTEPTAAEIQGPKIGPLLVMSEGLPIGEICYPSPFLIVLRDFTNDVVYEVKVRDLWDALQKAFEEQGL